MAGPPRLSGRRSTPRSWGWHHVGGARVRCSTARASAVCAVPGGAPPHACARGARADPPRGACSPRRGALPLTLQPGTPPHAPRVPTSHAGPPRRRRVAPVGPVPPATPSTPPTPGHHPPPLPPLPPPPQVKVDSVRVSQGSAVVYLKVLDSQGYVIPVHIGEAESNALLKEINKQRQSRPLTHDTAKSMLQAVGYRVTKIRVTDIIANTYYARIHLGRPASDPAAAPDEVDVDARPSDAINLAVRFGAPMFVARRIVAAAATPPLEPFGLSAVAASNAEIVRSVREALASYDDPTVMFQLQKELAIKEERFEDARSLHDTIVHEMTHNRTLRMVVAMETALADGRYEEAAKLRDEYRRLVSESALTTQAPRPTGE
ncbi:MAG: bifunctional nuclease-domain-containing protein [Monoraphidium minutum]|nr:MAG: bifunctional nuclease-domain-containing protein [Monoraphidium minutum]